MPRSSRSRSRSRSPSPALAAAAPRSIRRGRSPSRSSRSSRSRSRSASSSASSFSRSPRRRSRSRSRSSVDRVELTAEESSFVVGRGGACKAKIARVSGAALHFDDRRGAVEIRGSETARRRARKYIELVKAQRVGPVFLNPDENNDDDLSILTIPSDCIGYVTGKNGSTMKRFEEEWGSLVFFIEHSRAETGKSGVGKIAIFGDRRARRGTELKVMSAVETKSPGYFTKGVEEHVDDAEWGTDIVRVADEELSYALGKGGITRKKLARAARAILEYIGNFAFISGTRKERQRARDYLRWLLLQRRGPVSVQDIERRDDVVSCRIPGTCVAYITGIGGRTLRRIEEETGTFCFIDGERKGESERLLIFGGDEDSRRKTRRHIEDMIESKLRLDREYGSYNPRTGRRSFSRSRSRSRSRHHHHRSPSPSRATREEDKERSRHHHHHHHHKKRSPSFSRSRSRSRSPDAKRPRKESIPRSRSPSPAAPVSGSK